MAGDSSSAYRAHSARPRAQEELLRINEEAAKKPGSDERASAEWPRASEVFHWTTGIINKYKYSYTLF